MYKFMVLRGTTQQNDTYAAQAGVFTIDTEKKELRIHDGLTFGGHVIPGHLRYADLENYIKTLPIANISGLQAQLDTKLASTLLGVVGGVATLDSAGTIPSNQLPGYIDDIIEVDTLTSLPLVGDNGKLYVVKDTDTFYRWSGTTYIAISATIESTDALQEGGNLFYTPVRVRQALMATGDVTYAMETGTFSINVMKAVNGKVGDVVIDKTDIGLSNVDNYPTADKATAELGESGAHFLTPEMARYSLVQVNIGRDLAGQWLLDCKHLVETLTTEDGQVLTTEDGLVLDFEY